ncbi:MAG: hypothetical protein AAF413_01490 [Patescibacteria group bacterium]
MEKPYPFRRRMVLAVGSVLLVITGLSATGLAEDGVIGDAVAAEEPDGTDYSGLHVSYDSRDLMLCSRAKQLEIQPGMSRIEFAAHHSPFFNESHDRTYIDAVIDLNTPGDTRAELLPASGPGRMHILYDCEIVS